MHCASASATGNNDLYCLSDSLRRRAIVVLWRTRAVEDKDCVHHICVAHHKPIASGKPATSLFTYYHLSYMRWHVRFGSTRVMRIFTIILKMYKLLSGNQTFSNKCVLSQNIFKNTHTIYDTNKCAAHSKYFTI